MCTLASSRDFHYWLRVRHCSSSIQPRCPSSLFAHHINDGVTSFLLILDSWQTISRYLWYISRWASLFPSKLPDDDTAQKVTLGSTWLAFCTLHLRILLIWTWISNWSYRIAWRGALLFGAIKCDIQYRKARQFHIIIPLTLVEQYSSELIKWL
jgi:hypothetical protein